MASGFGLGHVPLLPGTAGALGGVLLSLALSGWPIRKQVLAGAVLVAIAVPIAGYGARAFPEHDDARIVADELLTFPVATLGLPIRQHPGLLAAAFVTSRVLDGLKPFPAQAVESLPGGVGVVMDDVVANAWALLLVSLGWRWFRRLPAAAGYGVSMAATLGAAAALPLGIIAFGGAAPAWLGYGALAWLAGLAVKLPLAAVTGVLLAQRSPGLQAGMLGMVSGLSELGIAVAILFWVGGDLSVADVLLYATAAGSMETLALGAWSLLVRPDADTVRRWRQVAERSAWVRHMFLIERSIALAGHVGSRGLVSLAVVTGNAWLALPALAGFILTDGLAAHRDIMGQDWMDPAWFRRMMGLFAAVAAIELGLFALLLPLAD
nr:phosphatidylglycerophosphatase A [Thioalkalivibrio sp. XN8]